ncbi:MAG: response regulator [Marinicaulis sp.]|nr:response regulator [Marinicaulis sp.]
MTDLAGKRVLLMEDEVVIAFEAEAALSALGIEVFPAYRLQAALELIKAESLDAAILDSNIHGERSDVVEEALRLLNIPFVRATGYGNIESKSDGVPVIDKPYDGQKLEAALREVLREVGQ